METLTKKEKFWLWVAQLDDREQEHMRSHNEKIILASGIEKYKPRIAESAYCSGIWCVWVESVLLESFGPPDGLSRAIEFAEKYSQGQES